MQKYKISFKGQNVFVGIDVHLKSWHVTAITESGFKLSLAIKPNAKILFDTLNRRFPDAHFIAAYEAGFTGFATYYSLMDAGIETIAVNAADIPTSQKEQLMKTDAVDSEKIARSLRAGELHGIYIKKREYMDAGVRGTARSICFTHKVWKSPNASARREVAGHAVSCAGWRKTFSCFPKRNARCKY